MAATGGAIRARLPSAVPARLLLPPLLAHWDAALLNGEAAACQLLVLLTSMLSAGDSKAAAAAAEPLFVFLLRALDTRQLQPPGLSPAGKPSATLE